MISSSNVYKLLNSIWLNKAKKDYTCYIRAIDNCFYTQESYLLRLLKKNRESVFGEKYEFHKIESIKQFQEKIPISTYADYLSYIKMIADGQQKVLTKEPVRLFEPTSGTSSAEKLIPYTAELQREFQRGINPWIRALYTIDSDIFTGKAYWSISPALTSKKKYGVIPIGFDNDWNYLGTIGKMLYSNLSVLPINSININDTNSFRKATLAGLVGTSDLTLISIWSPSFLRIMLDWYITNRDEIIKLLSSSPNGKKRAAYLKELSIDSNMFRHIWPKLRLVSCWTDASSKNEAKKLAHLLPHAKIQGKGLISTEAFISFPLSFSQDPALSILSHFFEFEDTKGNIMLANELETGNEYSVIVTTGGGLYRYRTGDKVLVTGFIKTVPTLKFLGKDNLVSDLYGEKLNSYHVQSVINSVLKELDFSFAMLAPDKFKNTHSYTLFIKTEDSIPLETPTHLDQLLQKNPNYRYCRKLGQLYPAQIFTISQNPTVIYEDTLAARGIKRGNIKLTPLSKLDIWSKVFKGKYIKT